MQKHSIVLIVLFILSIFISIWQGDTSAGWLYGLWSQNDIVNTVKRWCKNSLVKPPCLNAGHTKSLQLRENHRKPSVRTAEKCLAKERWAWFIVKPLYVQAQLACRPVTCTFRFREPRLTLISVNICNAARFRGSLHQITLSWKYQDTDVVSEDLNSRKFVLSTYQGAPAGMWRHLDCNSSSLMNWEQSLNLEIRHD